MKFIKNTLLIILFINIIIQCTKAKKKPELPPKSEKKIVEKKVIEKPIIKKDNTKKKNNIKREGIITRSNRLKRLPQKTWDVSNKHWKRVKNCNK